MNNLNQVYVYGFILVWVEIINENSLSRNRVTSTSGEGQVDGQTRMKQADELQTNGDIAELRWSFRVPSDIFIKFVLIDVHLNNVMCH